MSWFGLLDGLGDEVRTCEMEMVLILATKIKFVLAMDTVLNLKKVIAHVVCLALCGSRNAIRAKRLVIPVWH